MIKKLFILLIIMAIFIIPVSAEEFENVAEVTELKLAKDITINDINQTVIAEKMHKTRHGETGEVNTDTLKQMLLDQTISNVEYDRMVVLIYDKEQKNELIIDETDRKKIISDETIPDETIPDEIISEKLEETSPTKEELYQEHNELLIENDVKEQSFIVGLIEFLKNLIN